MGVSSPNQAIKKGTFPYLHNAVPIIPRRHSEQRKERHPKVGKVRMFPQSLAGEIIRTFEPAEQLNPQGREYEEEEEEKEAQVAYLRQGLHHGV